MGTLLHEIPEDSEEEKLSPIIEASPYQKLQAAVHDPKFSHEVALEKRVGLYKFCGDIGRGNFSRVKKAVHLLTKDKVAIKIVDRSRLDTKNLRMLSREVATLECVQHPYILRLFEVVETLGRVHLVTEFIHGGELYYKIVQNGVYPENKAMKIFKQLALAIQHMHHLGFVHRDVKAENVLVISDEHVKLGDFGFSTQISGPLHYLNTFCGSPPYASPELFNDDHYLGSPVDIWALGILLFFILIGNMPFSAPTVPLLRSTILKGEYRIPGYFTSSCVKLIQCILLHNPKHRPSIDQILNCEWLQQKPKKPQSPLHEARSIIQKRKKASFWCSKSRKTSPLSPFQQPIKQPEPIECYTKKYNNVPVEKFKNPLENDPKVSSAATVIPIHNNIGGALSRNNSLINSSKNVKKRNGVEVIQNNDIIQVRSYSNDDPTDDSSMDSEKDFDNFMMIPTRTHCDVNLRNALDPLEVETRKIMGSLGIDDDVLEKNIEQGPRSEVIGIYRIIIMRLKTQKEQASIKSHQSPVISDKLNNNHQLNSQKTKKKHNAAKCAIL